LHSACAYPIHGSFTTLSMFNYGSPTRTPTNSSRDGSYRHHHLFSYRMNQSTKWSAFSLIGAAAARPSSSCYAGRDTTPLRTVGLQKLIWATHAVLSRTILSS
ncbi:unnamed protein product, partial [Closterium sp. NIES-54]